MRKNKTEQYNYLLDYIREAADARVSLRQIIERVICAYKQHASHNTYQENANAYRQNIGNSDPEMARHLKLLCDSIPDATNDTVFNAVETFVSMAMGGASQFEYQPADEYAEKSAGLVDRLSELAKFFHEDNKIDSLVSKATRKLIMQGQANFFLEPIEEGRFKVSLIDAYKMLRDPRASKTNCERFIGFTENKSWGLIKAEIYKSKSNYFVKVLNDVDQYLEALTGTYEGTKWEDEISEDLNTFSSIYRVNQSKSVDAKGKETSPEEVGYKGDDVEVAYIYDLISNVYAVVINRRFIVQLEEDKLKKSVPVKYYDADLNEKTRNVTVRLDSPFVTIPFIEADWETFPVSPLFYCLDDFDAICSIESVMTHNLSIMAPITFQSASWDAEQMSKLSQVAGQIVEGTLQTFGVVNKAHDMGPCQMAIQRREERIKRMLGATDQFDLQAMLGNRATASEVTSASSAVSQRMNAPLANIETGMSEMTQKMFTMTIIYNKNDDFTFPYNGGVSTVSKEDLLGRSIIRAKLRSRIKIEQEQQGRNALMVLQTLIGAEQVNKENLIKTLVPIITQGIVNRRQAESFIAEQPVDLRAMMEVQKQIEDMSAQASQAQAAQNQADAEQAAYAEQNPITPDMVEGMSPDELSMIMQGAGMPTERIPYSRPMSQGTFGGAEPAVDTGYANDLAGLENNENIVQGTLY